MNNMGAMSLEMLEGFVRRVLSELALAPVWHMEWTTAGDMCEKSRHIIFIDEDVIGKYPWQGKERVLHETAHIFTDDKVHSTGFYAEYCKLLNRFMVEEEA